MTALRKASAQHCHFSSFKRYACFYKNPEIMLYLIIELVGSTCCNAVVNSEPCPMDDLRPCLMNAIRAIMRSMEV